MAKRLKYTPLKNRLRGNKLRSPKIICPECNGNSTIKKTVRKHPHLSDVYCACNNVECGHTFVVNITFSHTLSPSALSSDRAIKTLIDMMSPEQKQKTLYLLLPS
ncbi:ogr/Delta-like zinc finger family protein [Escherichia coli]|uniref:Ogr/Delta-like zinc finger protein n=1 Tax=Myoviridae sp. ctitt1 TaxID=2825157 RepID=A0A8S5QKZ4_9CAUD|nr:ogr/Delta-like zinc finger family protein [Escherichia coli]DAE19473.1 MAG TPA: Ogr/Delta-like zinc finger protein [Myoviridae sp. ctitt1]MEC9680051.1 ogr/Delta-like zinc finger family protein [Escherichia coli]MEC9992844.1 ogr/Delta-like zinc finger family protein [Escherichia coli]MED0064332.1 ogr/Delta-like zinc finger family protein [Escherichia coli]MED0130521.1 ogr/Delta-like zinc finger family protein [Escherichia coli]